MATISDIYRITSKASLSGIKAATKAVVSHGASIAGMARKAAAAAGKVLKAAFSIKSLGKIAGGAVRGLGALAKGFGVLLTGGLLLVIGALRLLPGLFDGMRTAMEGAGDAATGAASNLDDVTEAAGAAASGISNTVDVIEESTETVEGILGAFGKVGPGFIQAQGEIFEQSEAMSEGAIDAAEAATEAMENYDDAVGGAVQSTSRFGGALDRIGAAWTAAKNTIMRAIATAITPALEALAELMESPEFQEFVKLLAEDLADAAIALGKWFVGVAIPAIQDFMAAVKEAGGPIEFIKKKFQGWKTTALMVLAIIVGKVLMASNSIRDFFKRSLDSIKTFWNILKLAIIATLSSAATSAQTIMDGMVLIIKGSINNFLGLLERGINKAIDIINPFIKLFNMVAAEVGGFTIPEIDKVTIPLLQRGGITKSPFMAVVGDTPGPEVIAPLADLEGILRNTFGIPDVPGAVPAAGGTTIIEQILIQVGVDPGGLSPASAGQVTADSFIETMRRRGLQLSARS